LEPNFFIAGGSKCGTTNISYYLDLHPQVFVSKLNEPYYFCKWDLPKDFVRESMIRDEKKYLNLFKKATTHKAIGEATPSYLHSPNSAKMIKKRFPESKIIISIRNPIDRAHSGYFSNEFMNKDNQNFRDMINNHKKLIEDNEFFIYNILEPGFYSKHIKRFQNIFDKDNIKIIIFEDYIKNTENTIKSILEFLGLETNFQFIEQPKRGYRKPKNVFSEILFNSNIIRKMSTSLIPTVTRQKIGEQFLLKEVEKPKMLQTDRKYLKDLYQDEVKNLEIMLSKKLPWSDFKEK